MMIARLRLMLAGIARRLGWRLEDFWLGMLPVLAMEYRWVVVDGLYLFGSPHHQRKLSLMLRGSFEPFTVHVFKQVVKPGMVVLDIGAYLGYYALLASRRVGAHGKVYAFEADPRSYRFLLHNIQLNKCTRNVLAIAKAVSDQIEVRPFLLSSGDFTRSSLWEKHRDERSLDVDCTTVDEIVGGQPVHVIKIDIEGGELHALKGMERTLRRSDSVIMFVECNPSALSAAGGSVESLLGLLERFEFRVHVIDEDERCLRPVGDEIYGARDERGKRNYCNLYCSKGEGMNLSISVWPPSSRDEDPISLS
jgi:FkbM family methyltransferase